jgi:hypothetical protein
MLQMVLDELGCWSWWGVDVDGERCEGKVVSGSSLVVQLGGLNSAGHMSLKHLRGKPSRASHARTFD